MDFLRIETIGRLTADAKFFEAQGEKKAMVAFTVATNIGDDKTNYVECELRGERAEKLKQYLVKGKTVRVEGRPYVNAYLDGQNEPKGSQRVYVNDIQLGASPQGSGSGDPV